MSGTQLILCVSAVICSVHDVKGYKYIKSVGFYEPEGQPEFAVVSEEGLTGPEMEAICIAQRLGYTLVAPRSLKPEIIYNLCPGTSLVPLTTIENKKNVTWYGAEDTQFIKSPANAFFTATWQCVAVDNDTKFHCAVCAMPNKADVITQTLYPPHNNSNYDYVLELLSYDRIDDISTVANSSYLKKRLLDDLAEAFGISVDSLRWHRAELNGDERAVVYVYYHRDNDTMDWFYYVHWNDEYLKYGRVPDYEVTMIRLSTECPDPKTQLKNTKRVSFVTGDIRFKLDPLSRHINTSECFWNSSVESAAWSPPLRWITHLIQLPLDPNMAAKIRFLRGRELQLANKHLGIQSAICLATMPDEPDTVMNVKMIMEISNMLLRVNTIDVNASSAGFAFLSNSIPLYSARVFMIQTLGFSKPTSVNHAKYVNLLISEQVPANPVIGMAVTLDGDNDNNYTPEAKQLNLDNVNQPLKTAHIAVTVSESIAFAAERLQIATYAAHLDYNGTQNLDPTLGSWMALVQVTYKRNSSVGVNENKDFVDIAFKPAFRENKTQRGKCAKWLLDAEEWLGDDCRVLKSVHDGMMVCRCKEFFKVVDVMTNVYLIYGYDASLITFLSNHKTLITVFVIVTILSVLGLLSVILTALCFAKWRDDKGHKVFLQMIFALTVNLILGFTNNFVSIDTKTVGCIVVGVVRHYSFLAMFFWMLVLSGLQIRRITTISGSKATSHLVLKVSAIAWGLPLIPIIILLSWDTRFYKSEVSNRGYCYPEDVAFQATVQGPAGVILGINLVFFVVILNHIYGWVKCNNDMQVRKTTGNDRAEQLRRLRTSIFVFFLFGFTWMFHFLSEEGVINSEFLFEFLFLITASFHLFMLALFFIVLDENTRTLWLNTLRKKWRVWKI